jgi:hypothetical protein
MQILMFAGRQRTTFVCNLPFPGSARKDIFWCAIRAWFTVMDVNWFKKQLLYFDHRHFRPAIEPKAVPVDVTDAGIHI